MTTNAKTQISGGYRRGSLASKVVAAYRKAKKGLTSEQAFYRVQANEGFIESNFQTFKGCVSTLKSKGILTSTGTSRRMVDTGRQGEVLCINPKTKR